jgi:hypothetical protein
MADYLGLSGVFVCCQYPSFDPFELLSPSSAFPYRLDELVRLAYSEKSSRDQKDPDQYGIPEKMAGDEERGGFVMC